MSGMVDKKGNIKEPKDIGSNNTDEEFVVYFSKESGLTIAESEAVLNAFCKSMKKSLLLHECLHIRHIGTFYVKTRKASKVKFFDGSDKIVNPIKMVRFKPSASLKHGINGVKPEKKPLLKRPIL